MSIHSNCSACQQRRRLRIDTNRPVSDSALFERRRYSTNDNQGLGKRRTPGRPGSTLIAMSRFLAPGPHRWKIVLLFLLACTAGRAPAQVVPALRFGPHIAVFGTFNALKPDYKYYGDFTVYGASLGGYFQTPHVIGVEVRGSINRWGGEEHQESALAGPRASLHFGRYSPYVSMLGGGTNSWRWVSPPSKRTPRPKLGEDLGPSWQAVGGLDIHVKHHLSIRVAEFSYGKTYLDNWNLKSLTASAGIVYRIR
jgi:hypothetical protein